MTCQSSPSAISSEADHTAHAPRERTSGLPLVLVAETVDRVHHLPVRQHRRDLPTDLLDVAVDGPVGDDPLVAVHRVHELLAGIDPARAIGQHLEQLELYRREVEVRAADRRAISRLVELHTGLRVAL